VSEEQQFNLLFNFEKLEGNLNLLITVLNSE